MRNPKKLSKYYGSLEADYEKAKTLYERLSRKYPDYESNLGKYKGRDKDCKDMWHIQFWKDEEI